MPFTFTTPLPTLEKAVTIDQLHVTDVEIITPMPTADGTIPPPLVRIYYAVVHERADGTLHVLDVRNVTVDGSALAALKPDGTKTYYQNIKALVYQALQTAAALQPGTVS